MRASTFANFCFALPWPLPPCLMVIELPYASCPIRHLLLGPKVWTKGMLRYMGVL